MDVFQLEYAADHRRLAAGSSPRWSRNGTRLAYIADGQIHLRWMDTGETATLTQLTESPSGIRWSPDGRYIAFNMLVPSAPPSLAASPKPPPGADWADPPIMEDRFMSRRPSQLMAKIANVVAWFEKYRVAGVS